MSDEGKKALRCSFCGKREQQVHRMIQGPGVRICDECVQLCMSILNEGFDGPETTPLEDVPDQLPTPKEIRAVLFCCKEAEKRYFGVGKSVRHF